MKLQDIDFRLYVSDEDKYKILADLKEKKRVYREIRTQRTRS